MSSRPTNDSPASPLLHAIHTLETQTGVVIPVYFHADNDPVQGQAILHDTVQMFVREVANPQSLLLSVDGPGPGEQIARAVAANSGVQVVVGPRNRGKYGAVAQGMRVLLGHDRLRYFAAVDQDGDHFSNDLLNFVRAALHIVEVDGSENLLVLGNRASRHRPLGLLRAEQEELGNRLLMDALAYAAAMQGQPLRLQFLTTTEPLPDFHSGYKLFSRTAAQAAFAQDAPLAGLDETAAYRHACEAVMVVEAHLAGATLAAVNRRTFDEQPMSLFAAYNRAQLAANLILWPCKRLNIPAPFVAQWLANHLPTLLLGTLAPQGQDELCAIRDLVLAGYGLDAATPPAPFTRPRFV